MPDRNRGGGCARRHPGAGADGPGAGGQSCELGLLGAVRRWTHAPGSCSHGFDRGTGRGGDIVLRVVPDVARDSSPARVATQGAVRPIMEFVPILMALKRNKVGAILVALQIALTLAVVANGMSIIQGHLAAMGRSSGIDEANIFTFQNH